MKIIPRISTEQEAHLMQTLNEAAGFMAEDMTPKDALVKAARDAALPRGHIELLVRAFNTGQALDQQAHSDYQQKSAAYEIVDAEEVINEVFPAVVKSAAAKGKVDYSNYTELPPWLEKSRPQPNKPLTVKSASSFPHVRKTPETTRVKRAQLECDKERKAVQELQIEVTALEKRASTAVAALTEYFGPYGSVPGRIPACAVLENSELLWGPFAGTIVKTASRQIVPSQFRHIHQVDESRSPYKEVVELLDVLPQLSEKRAAYAALMDAHQQRVDADRTLFTTWTRTKEAQGIGRGQAIGLMMAKDWAGELSNQFRVAPDDDEVARGAAQIGTPDHENRLRDIQARAMLQDLFSNDAVLAGHDPRDLADSYNSLSLLAPVAMQNPELARGIMRKRMEAGSLEPFELQQLSALNSALVPGQLPKPPAQSTPAR